MCAHILSLRAKATPIEGEAAERAREIANRCRFSPLPFAVSHCVLLVIIASGYPQQRRRRRHLVLPTARHTDGQIYYATIAERAPLLIDCVEYYNFFNFIAYFNFVVAVFF